MIYRDPLADVRRRVAEKRARITEQKRALGPLRRAVLSPDALASLDALDAATDSFDDASLRAIDERLDELAERLEGAMIASTALLADRGEPELPDVAPRSLRWGVAVDVHDDVARALPDAELADWGALATGARFQRAGAALFLLATATHQPLAPRTETLLSLTLAVGVPRALPAVEIERRGRSRGNLEVGRALLGDALDIPDGMSLGVADGRACVSWQGVDFERLPYAIEVLLRVRRAIADA